MNYRDELTSAMTSLGAMDEAIFLGQAVQYAGTAMTDTLKGVPHGKLVEMPVEEEFQAGHSIGLAIAGLLPISIFPRWNFLLLGFNQLINHLDKAGELLNALPPKVIFRTSVGSIEPLHPGPQHVGNFSEALRALAPNLNVVELRRAEEIVPAYTKAAMREDGVSSVLVEFGDLNK